MPDLNDAGALRRVRVALLLLALPALLPARVASAAPAGARPAGGQTVAPLRILAQQAERIVLARVAAIEAHDETRLRVYRLDVERSLTEAGSVVPVAIVEARGALERPPYAALGSRVVALLASAPESSYLTLHLGRGAHVVLVGDRDGLIPITDETTLAVITRVVAVGRGATPDLGSARRGLAFAELATLNTRLVSDGILELRDLPPPGPLSTTELAAVQTALAAASLHPALRVALLDLLADHAVTAAVPALASTAHASPDVLGAWLVARVRLGDLPEPSALEPYLEDAEPAVRIAAVRALAWHPATAALQTLATHTRTDVLAVRRAAIEELEVARRPAALSLLVETFADQDRALQQASARAMLAIDGTEVEDALIELALHGNTHRTRTYAAALLLTHRPPNHPALRRLAASDPPPEVQHLIDEGLESSHRHGD